MFDKRVSKVLYCLHFRPFRAGRAQPPGRPGRPHLGPPTLPKEHQSTIYTCFGALRPPEAPRDRIYMHFCAGRRAKHRPQWCLAHHGKG